MHVRGRVYNDLHCILERAHRDLPVAPAAAELFVPYYIGEIIYRTDKVLPVDFLFRKLDKIGICLNIDLQTAPCTAAQLYDVLFCLPEMGKIPFGLFRGKTDRLLQPAANQELLQPVVRDRIPAESPVESKIFGILPLKKSGK